MLKVAGAGILGVLLVITTYLSIIGGLFYFGLWALRQFGVV